MKNFLLLVGVAFSLMGYSQDIDAWRKKFPDAAAVFSNIQNEVKIELHNGKLEASSTYSTDVSYLTEVGVKAMSQGYIYHSNFNVLNKWEAYTQALGLRKIKVSESKTTSASSAGIFYDDAKLTQFNYLGAAIGANSHLEYDIEHKDVHLLSPFYFDRYYPVIKGELKITFPDDVSVKYLIKGNKADKVKFNEQRKKGKVTYSFSVEDFEDERAYPGAPDNSYYATHVIFYVEKYQESGKWVNYLSNEDDLYNNSYKYIKEINKEISNELKMKTDSLVSGLKSDKAKAQVIYNWVQHNIKYVAFEEGMGGFVPREASLVFNRRFGDCKDMASILTGMLRYAGLSAYFSWIGTRDIPYDYTNVPLPIVDNHMICAIKLDGKYIFLDGTASHCFFGIPPSAIQGKQTMIAISETQYEIVRVPVMDKEFSTLHDTTFLQLTEKGLIGTIRMQLTGYLAMDVNGVLDRITEKDKEEYYRAIFARGSNKAKLTNFKAEKGDNDDLILSAQIELPDYAKRLGDEWYLNMNLFKLYEHDRIDYPKRQIPIEHDYKKQEWYVTVLKLPEGYKWGYIPSGKEYHNETGGFNVSYRELPTEVIFTQQLGTELLMVYPYQFQNWNKVLENLVPLYKESILISKK